MTHVIAFISGAVALWVGLNKWVDWEETKHNERALPKGDTGYER